MKTENPGVVISVENKGDRVMEKNNFCDTEGFYFNSEENNNRVVGVCMADTDVGDFAPVMVTGVSLVLSGGAVSVGDKVYTDGGPAFKINFSGPPTTYELQKVCGMALDAASASGELIRVKLN